MGKGPLYGDMEAQRHWMEITIHLPVYDWYLTLAHNDLLYWGLDYPPLTAFHEYALGKIAEYICPEVVTFEASRGCETSTCIVITHIANVYCSSFLDCPCWLWIYWYIFRLACLSPILLWTYRNHIRLLFHSS